MGLDTLLFGNVLQLQIVEENRFMTTVIECHPPAAGKPAPDLKALKAKHDANRLLFLRIALMVIGLTFISGIYTLGISPRAGYGDRDTHTI